MRMYGNATICLLYLVKLGMYNDQKENIKEKIIHRNTKIKEINFSNDIISGIKV